MGVEDPYLNINEDGIIHLRQGKRDSHCDLSDFYKNLQWTLLTSLYILHRIDKEFEGENFLENVEYPALSRIVRLVLDDKISDTTAQKYAFFLKRLVNFSGKVI